MQTTVVVSKKIPHCCARLVALPGEAHAHTARHIAHTVAPEEFVQLRVDADLGAAGGVDMLCAHTDAYTIIYIVYV